MLYLLIY